MSDNCIVLSPEMAASIPRFEALADAAQSPGHLLERTTTGVKVNATADDVVPEILIADVSVGEAGDITRAYTTGETVHFVAPPPGTIVKMILSTSQTIAIGAQLASTGDGTVKAPAVANVGVVGYAVEAVTTTAATDYIKVRVK